MYSGPIIRPSDNGSNSLSGKSKWPDNETSWVLLWPDNGFGRIMEPAWLHYPGVSDLTLGSYRPTNFHLPNFHQTTNYLIYLYFVTPDLICWPVSCCD